MLLQKLLSSMLTDKWIGLFKDSTVMLKKIAIYRSNFITKPCGMHIFLEMSMMDGSEGKKNIGFWMHLFPTVKSSHHRRCLLGLKLHDWHRLSKIGKIYIFNIQQVNIWLTDRIYKISLEITSILIVSYRFWCTNTMNTDHLILGS